MTTQIGHLIDEVPRCDAASDSHSEDTAQDRQDARAKTGFGADMRAFREDRNALRRRLATSRRLQPLDNGAVDPITPNERWRHALQVAICSEPDQLLGINGDRRPVDRALDYWHVTLMDRGLAEREAAGRGWLV